MSRKIDAYYSALDEGIQKKKPAPKMTKWWWNICRKIEARNFYQWSDVATILHNVSRSEQQRLTAEVKRIKKDVMKHWRNPNHLCSVTLTPPKEKMDALAVYLFRDRQRDDRYNRMQNIASRIFSSSGATRCLVIAVNIDKEDYPYSTLAVFFAGSAA